MSRRIAPVIFLSLVALSQPSPSPAGQPITSEQIFPKRTLAVVKVPNAAEFRRKWNASSMGAMQRDPAFRPFFADLERQADRLASGVKRTLGVGVKQVWLSLEGEVALALVHSPESGLALAGAVELAPDASSAARRVAALEAALGAGGARDVRLKAGDLDVVSWSVGSGDEQFTFSYFRRGTHLVLSQDLNALLAVAAAARAGASATLAANPVYKSIADETRVSSGEPTVQWYVDPVGLLKAAVSDNLEGNPNRDLVTGLLSQAGLDSFKGIGGSVELASALADNVTRTFGYVEPPAGGLLRAFALPATHQVPPSWVKEDANLYMQINWSGPKFYRAVESFFDSFKGAGAFGSLLGSGRMPNTDATFRDVLDQLVGPLHVVATLPTSTGELLSQPAVVAIEVRDPKRAGAMLREIARAAGAHEESIGGVPGYRLQFGLPNGGLSLDVAFSIAEGSLMVSTSPRYLESLLAGRDKKRALARSPRYQAAVGQFPRKTSLLSYSRQDRRFERLYEQIRSGGFRLPLYGGIVTGLGLDFSKLPPGAAIRPYLATSAGFIEPAEKGFRMIDIGYWPPRLPARPTPEKP